MTADGVNGSSSIESLNTNSLPLRPMYIETATMSSESVPLLHRVDCALRESPHLMGRHVILEEDEDRSSFVERLIVFSRSRWPKKRAMSTRIGRIENHLEVAGRR